MPAIYLHFKSTKVTTLLLCWLWIWFGCGWLHFICESSVIIEQHCCGCYQKSMCLKLVESQSTGNQFDILRYKKFPFAISNTLLWFTTNKSMRSTTHYWNFIANFVGKTQMFHFLYKQVSDTFCQVKSTFMDSKVSEKVTDNDYGHFMPCAHFFIHVWGLFRFHTDIRMSKFLCQHSLIQSGISSKIIGPFACHSIAPT